MQNKRPSSLYEAVINKYKEGRVSIGVNKGFSLALYSKVSKNPLIKLFSYIVNIYTFPLTVLVAVFCFLYFHLYYYILYFLGGLFVLLYAEDYMLRKIIVSCALKNQDIFSDLYQKGAIKVKEGEKKKKRR